MAVGETGAADSPAPTGSAPGLAGPRVASRLVTALLAAVVVVVLGLVAAGCGSDDDDPLAGSPEDATATTTSTSVALPTTTAPDSPTTTSGSSGGSVPEGDDVLVELSTSGGLDGRGLGNLVVTAAGAVDRTGPDAPVEQDALATDELDALVDLLAGTDFADIPAEPDHGTSCADAFVYTVRYRQWTVSADDCTIPDELAPVLDRLQDLMARFD